MRKIKTEKDIKEIANELVTNYERLLRKLRKRNVNNSARN
jgi:hypothetical protein